MNKKLALNSGIQTYQILINDDEVCIPRLSSILTAVPLCAIAYFVKFFADLVYSISICSLIFVIARKCFAVANFKLTRTKNGKFFSYLQTN